MATLNYEKYQNMTKRQIAISLESAEKRMQILQENYRTKMEEQTQLIRFLKAKMTEALKNTNSNFKPLEETKIYKEFKEIEAKMTEQERKDLKNEVLKEINTDYSDEN